MKLKYKKLLNKLMVIGILVLFIIIFSLMKLNENIAEYFYARGISRAYVFVVGSLSDLLPFSIFEVFVFLAVLALIISFAVIIKRLVKKQRTEAVSLLEKVIIAVLVGVLIYTITASGCYYRKELPLPKYQGEQLSNEKTVEIVDAYLKDFSDISNSLTYREDGTSVCPYTFDEINELLITEYARLDEMDGYFTSYTSHTKPMLVSEIMSYFGTCGITFMPLGEANINAKTPSCYLTVVMAHELAHTKGVMREKDANMVAYYLLSSSSIPYFRYCAYMYSINYLTSVLNVLDRDLYVKSMQSYPQKARIERSRENAYWASKETFLDSVGEFFNDIYLKLSGVKNGTGNYSDPSDVTIEKIPSGDTVIEVVKVHYSDTARMLIHNAVVNFGIEL